MNPEIISFLGISIRWYSVLILLGIIIGIFLAEKEAKKFNFPKDFIFDFAFWCIIVGILGARAYYVLFNFSYYKNDFFEIFRVWNGGLAIHGGLIAGFITALVYCRIKKQKLFKVTDIAVVSVILAQAIGRWGNFFNGEAHGPITTLENLQALHLPSFVIKGMYIDGVYYQPTFLYESLWCILGFILLLFIRKMFKHLKTGQLTCFYLVWYGIGRYFIESLRTDSLMLGGLKAAQLVSISCIFVGIIFFIYLSLKNGEYYYSEDDK